MTPQPQRQPDRPPRRGPLVRAALLAALVLTGCRDKPTSQPAGADHDKQQTTMPTTIPGMEQDRPGATDVMVKAAYDRGEKETYTHDPRHPAGTLVGGVRFAKTDKPVKIPAAYVLDIAGPNAIKDPEPKETAYYKNIEIRPPEALQSPRRKKVLYVVKHGDTYIPCNVVLRVRDVKVGRLPPLDRCAMVVHHGIVIPGDDGNHGGNDVQFCPLHDRLQLTTWDEPPCRLVLTRQESGKVAFETPLRYVQTKDTRVNGKVEVGHLAYKPQLLSSPPLRHPGLYVLTCRRHPWQRGYLWVVDNPYVTTTVWAVYRNPRCNFRIENLPPGKHTIDVWHPIYKPLKPTVEVQIEQDRVHELLIEFHPPT